MGMLVEHDVDPWIRVEDPLENYLDYPWFSLVPLTALQQVKQWPLPQAWIGAWFHVDIDLSLLTRPVLDLPLLNIDMTDFTDGRVFTLAKHLKTRLGYGGQLRVSGKFLLDQMAMLRDCGIDSFSLPKDSDHEHARFILKHTPKIKL